MISFRNAPVLLLFSFSFMLFAGCTALSNLDKESPPRLVVREIYVGRYEPASLQLAGMRMERSGETAAFSEEDAMEEACYPPRIIVPPMTEGAISLLHRVNGKTITAVSPDGKRWAFARGFRGGKCYLRVDGIWKGGSEDIRFVQFSPDSQRLAYATKVLGKWHVQVDKKGSEVYGDITEVKFSPDSKRILFIASRDEKGESACVVVDGKEGKQYDKVSMPVFSPDSRHYAYLASEEKNGIVVEDGVELGKCNKLISPVFSPDSQHFAYALSEENGFTVMKDEVKVGNTYDEIRGITFSPDSAHVAFIARSRGRECVVLDGMEKKTFDSVQWIVFSEDARHMAYVAKQDDRERVILDDTEGKQHMQIRSMVFEPGTSRLDYIGWDKSGCVVVADGVEGKCYEWIISDLIFSPDGKRLAYLAGKMYGGEAFIVVDGREVVKYTGNDSRSDPIFSPDSRHVAYYGGVGKDPFHKQPFFGVDGVMTETLAGSFLEGTLAFDAPDRCHALVMRGANLFLIEITIEE